MEAVVREIDQWPPPVPGQTVHLPLIGVLFQVKDMLQLYKTVLIQDWKSPVSEKDHVKFQFLFYPMK